MLPVFDNLSIPLFKATTTGYVCWKSKFTVSTSIYIYFFFLLLTSHNTYIRVCTVIMYKKLVNWMNATISNGMALTFNWDLDTFPRWSTSRAVKACHMDFKRSSRDHISLSSLGARECVRGFVPLGLHVRVNSWCRPPVSCPARQSLVMAPSCATFGTLRLLRSFFAWNGPLQRPPLVKIGYIISLTVQLIVPWIEIKTEYCTWFSFSGK